MSGSHSSSAAVMGDRAATFTCVVVGDGTLTQECCRLLRDRGHQVKAVVTRSTELAAWAEAHGVQRVEPKGGDDGWGLAAVDYLFSVVNLHVLGPRALALAEVAAINFHDGPLPTYTGLNTPTWAIINREREHAVTWHLMDQVVDAGAVLLSRPVALDPFETSVSLNTKCFEAGLATFVDLLTRLECGDLTAAPQGVEGRVTYGRDKRPAAGGAIDPSHTSEEIAALVRALRFGRYPNPLCLPHLCVGGKNVTLTQATVHPATGEAAVGAVLAISDTGLRLRTAAGDIDLSGFVGDDLEPLTPPAAAASLGLAVGDVIDPPAPAVVAGHRRATTRWARHEPAWVERLANAGPLVQAPYLKATQRGGQGARQAVALKLPSATRLPAEGRGDAVLAVATALLARLGQAAAGTIPLQHPALNEVPDAAAVLFATHVPLTFDLAVDMTLSEWLASYGATLTETMAQGSFPRDIYLRYPELAAIDRAWPTRNWPVTLERVANLSDGQVDCSPAATLTLVIADDGSCTWRYDPSAGDRTLVTRLHQRLEAFLGDLLDGASLHDATLFSPRDRAELDAWNSTYQAVVDEPSIAAAFEAQVRRSPERAAVVGERETLTYAELNARANRLARRVRGLGVERGSLVGILTGRTPDMLVAVLAVLKAGCAYVPLDPAFPRERLAFMVEDAGLSLVIADSRNVAAVGDAARLLVLEAERAAVASESADDLAVPVRRDDLAYVIYTSGSTGLPKGVMLEHGNVLNFMAAMDTELEPQDPPGTWLAVTSISFDISVLELLWTLARGFEVVLYAGEDLRGDTATTPEEGAAGRGASPAQKGPEFSLFYFSADAGGDSDKYRLLLEGARFADANGFAAVWTPERHFHAFGGIYPNPAVAGAAIAAITERVRIRAGSCVLPLHHPVRVAEEWAVVDNLSGGRVDVSFASGWQPHDFVLAPENHAERNEVMYAGIETVRALWRGEQREFIGPHGKPVTLGTLPRPLQPELPVWVTAAGNPKTFRRAGEIGAGILTHLLGQNLTELAAKVKEYREGWVASGRPGRGHVTLMLHTFVGDDPEEVKRVAKGPLRDYLKTATELVKQYASSFPAFKGADATSREEVDARFKSLSQEDLDALLDHAFERYYETSGLFGTVEQALAMVGRTVAADVDEIACLIDFGIGTDDVLASLEHLDRLRRRAAERPSRSVPELIARHRVTHMQCTPSLARMLLAQPRGPEALGALDKLLVGGEALSRELAAQLTETLSGSLMNMYGPTETTIWSTVAHVDAAALANAGPTVGIGRPIANTDVHVLDDRGRPLPPGVPGELAIGGAGVARGYWRRPEVTAERFVTAHPSLPGSEADANGEEPKRLYRTGDMARWRFVGDLEYLGRLDFQVKVRGHRIELGEIESVLNAHASVREAVVAARATDAGDTRLVAYVIAADAGPLDVARLRGYLEQRLPAIMIPSAFVELDSFPLTPNKKLDRKALPEPEPAPRSLQVGSATPMGEVEATLAAIWRRVLSVESVGVDDDFFELGGNSLLAVFAVSEANKQGLALTLGQLLRSPTIAGLVASGLNREPSWGVRPSRSPEPS